jgi:hypothetical protein
MNSPGHRKNILSKDALQLGCGAAFFLTTEFNDMPTFYIVQNFQCFEPVQKDYCQPVHFFERKFIIFQKFLQHFLNTYVSNSE